LRQAKFRMKIFWLCPFFPFPLSTGIRIREFNIIRVMSKWHDIFLFSLIQSIHEDINIECLQPFCRSIEAIYPESQHVSAIDGKRSGLNALKGILQKNPENFYGKPSENVVNRIQDILSLRKFDLLIVDTLFMSNYVWNFLPKLDIPKVLIEHNIEYLIQAQQYKKATGTINRLRKFLYYSSFKGFEQSAYSWFDRIVTVSDVDCRELLNFAPFVQPEKVIVIPNGVDTQKLTPKDAYPQANTIIFNGSLTYEANFDAVKYFLEEIFPTIYQNKPEIRFLITGSIEGVDLKSLKTNRNVTFTGYLDDVHTVVKNSYVCVVPLKWGGGTRLKVLEAISLGTPVVSTTKGIEGLGLIPDRDVLVADEPAQFAKMVLQILDDPDLRKKLSNSGRAVIEHNFDWESIGAKFNDILQNEK
jgi:glycosyltransferase involved in cell wall biosynthesis